MILSLLLAAQAVAGPGETPDARLERCIDLAAAEPDRALADAAAWRLSGGGFRARQCEGLAYSQKRNFAGAGGAFQEAARAAEVAKDDRAASLWAQSGNAWLAGGDAAKAKVALDAALASGGLKGLALGEAHLDRARARVAAGELPAARGDLDQALVTAKDDPLAWLLSATLARRMGDLARAKTDIAGALERSPDDASVQLEAGNIAAAAGDEAGARTAWTKAAQLGTGGPVADWAQAALAQFSAGK